MKKNTTKTHDAPAGPIDAYLGTENEADHTIAQKAEGNFQLVDTFVLAAAARGELDLNELAMAELAFRGLDENGNWIGHTEAANHFNSQLRSRWQHSDKRRNADRNFGAGAREANARREKACEVYRPVFGPDTDITC